MRERFLPLVVECVYSLAKLPYYILMSSQDQPNTSFKTHIAPLSCNLLPSGKRGNGSCNVGWKSELAYVCMYIYMSVTLRNAIITTHVDTSRTGTVSTWLTGDTSTLDDDCVGYKYRDIEAELMRRVGRVQGLLIT